MYKINKSIDNLSFSELSDRNSYFLNVTPFSIQRKVLFTYNNVSEYKDAIKLILLVNLLLTSKVDFNKFLFSQLIYSTAKIKNEVVHRSRLTAFFRYNCTKSLLSQPLNINSFELLNIWFYLNNMRFNSLSSNYYLLKTFIYYSFTKFKFSNLISYDNTNINSHTKNIYLSFKPQHLKDKYLGQINNIFFRSYTYNYDIN